MISIWFGYGLEFIWSCEHIILTPCTYWYAQKMWQAYFNAKNVNVSSTHAWIKRKFFRRHSNWKFLYRREFFFKCLGAARVSSIFCNRQNCLNFSRVKIKPKSNCILVVNIISVNASSLSSCFWIYWKAFMMEPAIVWNKPARFGILLKAFITSR